MAFSRATVENALRTWVVASAPGLTDVVFADQHGGQPNNPYATIKLRPLRKVFTLDELRWSTALAWAALTSYAVGARVINGSNLYQCTTAGASAGSGGPTGTGAGIADGSCVWSYAGASAGAEVLPTVVGQREFMVSVETFSDAVVSANTALDFLEQVLVTLAMPSTQAAFSAALFCFVDATQPQDLSALLSTKIASRALVELRFRTVDAANDLPTGYIATAAPTPTYS